MSASGPSLRSDPATRYVGVILRLLLPEASGRRLPPIGAIVAVVPPGTGAGASETTDFLPWELRLAAGRMLSFSGVPEPRRRFDSGGFMHERRCQGILPVSQDTGFSLCRRTASSPRKPLGSTARPL